MSANVSGGLWSLVGFGVAAATTWLGSSFAGLDVPIQVALVSSVGGLVATTTNTFFTSRNGRQQAAVTATRNKELERYKGEIQEQLSKLGRDHTRELAAQRDAHEKELEHVRSNLAKVEDKERQLRAHSLGLEAQRRQNFETRRAEACTDLFAEISTCINLLLRVIAEVDTHVKAQAKAPGAIQRTSPDRLQLLCHERLPALFNVTERSALFISPNTHRAAEALALEIGDWRVDLTRLIHGEQPQPRSLETLHRQRTHLRALLRDEMLSALDSRH